MTAHGGVAQLGERTVRIRKVKGSNPSVSTNLGKSGFRLPFFLAVRRSLKDMEYLCLSIIENELLSW